MEDTTSQGDTSAVEGRPQAVPRPRFRRRVNWTAVGAISSGIGSLAAAVTLMFASSQIEATKRVTRAQLVIDYFELLQEHNWIHRELELGGTWSEPSAGPREEDAFETRRYMGLLEQIEVFVDSDVLPIEVADSNYGHRIHAIYRNDVIRSEIIQARPERWCLLLSLVKRLEENGQSFRQLQKEHDARRGAPLPPIAIPDSCTGA